MEIIKQITDEIESVGGVKLLDVDPGKDTNRTVVTFVGDPGSVVEFENGSGCFTALGAIGKRAEKVADEVRALGRKSLAISLRSVWPM